MEFFVHPWYMAAGGALISSPIIIHLINRMRFKRVRWAAMEFLLKAQKKKQRRRILEQLLLLLLRILLVLLAGFLVARFLYGGSTTKGADHVVILDNTLSMSDHHKKGERTASAFEEAKEQLKAVVRNAAQAPSEQRLRVFLLTDLSEPIYNDRISDRTLEKLDAEFATKAKSASALHVSPAVGLEKGRALLRDVKDTTKVLHFISDFRDTDWAPGTEGDKVVEQLKGAVEDGLSVNLFDVSDPLRQREGKAVTYHDNLAITEFKPETRVAVEERDVGFSVKIQNFGTTQGNGYLQVFVNGQEDLAQAQLLQNIKVGETVQSFSLRFPSRNRPELAISDKDSPGERERKRRLQRDYFHIRVMLSRSPTERAEPQGINADNCADLVMEVRKKVPVLLVDGNRPDRQGDGSDLVHIQSFATGSDTYELEIVKADDLARIDLDLYPTVFLVNVAELPPPVVKKLKSYVDQGGSLCYFLGEEVRSDHYNTVLFKEGLFPLQIGPAPYDSLTGSMSDADHADLDKRKAERLRRRTQDPAPKILFPKPENPLVSGLTADPRWLGAFRFLSVNYYWRALPRNQWDPEPHRAEELIVLPNASSLDRYKGEAVRLVRQVVEKTTKLGDRESEMKPFVALVQGYERELNEALLTGQTFALGKVLDGLLFDRGQTEEPRRPAMTDLWKVKEMSSLEAELKSFREQVLYGDPLLVSRPEGKGRVVAILTTAGTAPRRGAGGENDVQWNNWGAGDEWVAQTYPMFLIGLHRYLISEGQTPNRTVGNPIEFQVDSARYEPKVNWTFTPQPNLDEIGGGKVAEDKQTTQMVKGVDGKSLVFELKNEAVTRPGVYRLELTHIGEGDEKERQEARAFALNVDTTESPLKRASRERLEVTVKNKDQKTGSVTLYVPGDNIERFRERTKDASQPPWLYLFFVIVLLVEQAMAVYLSFHVKGGEAGAPATTPQPVAA
jgi:Aerotolerance regulator N-terminal